MEKFVLESSPKTPKIQFDIDSGQFEISGRSIPENSIEFYNPLLNWLEQNLRTSRQGITLDIKLEYFNTSSSKCLYQIFKGIKRIADGGRSVVINWMYDIDDEDMREVGEDYSDILGLEFNYMEMDF